MKPHLRPDLTTTYERYVSGAMFRFGPLEVRLVSGRKGPADTRLDIRCAEWHSMTFDELALMVDVLYENEHRLFPPRMGYEGGDKLIKHLRDAIRLGPEKAAALLRLEKATRAPTLFDNEAS